jgi:CubicO group peptidase (beta-lactamase class C family)
MHRTLRSLVVVPLALLVSVPLGAQSPLRGTALAEKIDSLGRALVEGGETVAVSIGVSVNGEVVHTAGYGFADLENDVRADAGTVYRIGSVTKQVTAAAIMRLVESGDVDLDADFTTYLPEYPADGRGVTVRQLLHHTSGIRSYTGIPTFRAEISRDDLEDAELVEYFAAEPPDFAPGERFLYNNSGYFMLGMIVEAVTGTPYREYVEAELFRPLGMEQSWYCDDRRVIPDRAEGYDVTPEGVRNAQPISMNLPGAAGSLCSTVEDLLVWNERLHDGEVVSEASLSEMTTSGVLNDGSPTGYGFGLGMRELDGLDVVSHGGGINGFSSYLAHVPGTDTDIAVLTNVGGGPAGPAFETITRWVHGIEVAPVLDLEMTAEQQNFYTGTFQLQEGFDLRVFIENGQLMAGATGQGAFRLRAQGDHAFIPTFDDDVRVVFHVEDEQVVALTLYQGGARRAPKIGNSLR